MEQKSVAPGFRTFLLIWFGQLISLTGTGLTGFALGVWVYQRTGSVTQYALIALATTLPGGSCSPRLPVRWSTAGTGAGRCS